MSVEKVLRDAVGWKIFEWQAILVGGDTLSVTPRELHDAKAWLQPQHLEEVVKERAYSGRCGYPLCTNCIQVPPSNIEERESPSFKINYNTKELHEMTNLDLLYYCSKGDHECIQKSKRFMLEMDDSIPATRPIAQDLSTLTPSKSRENAAVDELLTTLSLVSPTKAIQQQKKEKEEEKEKSKDGGVKGGQEAARMIEAENGPAQSQPPLYNNTKFTQRGALKPQEWSINNSYAPNKTKAPGPAGKGPPSPGKKAGGGESIRDLAMKMQNTNNSRNNSAAVSRALDVLNKLDKDPSNIRGDSHYVTEAEAAEISKQRLQQQVPRGATELPGPGGLTPGGGGVVGGSGIKKIKDHKREKEGPVKYPAPSTLSAMSPGKSPAASKSKDDEEKEKDDKDESEGADAKSANPTAQPIYHNHTSVSSPSARRPAALRNKYKSSTMSMSMMGSGDIQQKSSPSPSPAKKTTPLKEAIIAPAKDSSDKTQQKQEKGEKGEKGEKKEVGVVSDDEDESAYMDLEGRYMNSPENALKGDDFSSWRENRLDTSQYKGDTMTESALLNSKPKPRARMHPKGKRALEIAERKKKEEEEMKRLKAIEDMELALPAGSDPELLAFAKKSEEVAIVGDNDDKKKGALGDYDNGLRVAKGREVQWKEPNGEYNRARGMKSVEKRERGPTDREKVSKFKQQLLERQAANKALSAIVDNDSKDSVTIDASVTGRDTKSTKLSIVENEDPTCLPERDMVDKYDTSAIEGYSTARSVFEDDPADLSPSQKAKRLQSSSNNQLRSAFFSAEGVSATFLPKGFAYPVTTNGESKQKFSDEKHGDALDDVIEDDDEEEDDEDGEGDFDEEAYSDYSDDSQPAPAPIARKSTFLELWEAYDEMISHCGPIFSKKQRGGQDMADDATVYNVMQDPVASIRRQLSEEESKEVANIDGYTAAGNAGQGLPMSVNAAASELTLQFLKRGFTSAETVLNLRESCGVKNTATYHVQKNRLLAVIDLSRQVPPFSQTGWLVFATLIIDGIVRMRQLYSNVEEWNGKVADIVAQANNRGLNINAEETRVLRTFFDDL